MRYSLICTIVVLALDTQTTLRADEPREGIKEHKALPKLGGEPTLRFVIQMSRKVWGEWESPRFDCRVVNATNKTIQFVDGDIGRGFAGKVTYLRDSRGKIRSFGSHWAEPVHNRPNFLNSPKPFEPNAEILKFARLELSAYFGSLPPGKHTV